jgi:hypothetical protein
MSRIKPLVVLVAAIATLSLCAPLASAQIPANGSAPSVATPVFNIDDPGRVPYQATEASDACSLGFCEFIFNAVPAGHRLVIQRVSAALSTTDILDDSTKVIGYLASDYGHGLSAFTAHPFVGWLLGNFDQPVEFFVDAGDVPYLQLLLFVSSFSPGSGSATLFGYLVDCTKAPCEAITGDSVKAPHLKFPAKPQK